MAVAKNGDENPTYILSLADIHFYPYFICETEAKRPCPFLEKLRAAPAKEWPSLFTQFPIKMSSSRRDTDFILFESALRKAKQVAEHHHVTSVLVLGDFLGHQFKKRYKKYAGDKSEYAYRSFVDKTMTFISNALVANFPGIDVYSVVGNNDTYDHHYVSEPNGPFFRDMFAIWSRQVVNHPLIQTKDFNLAGYYAIDIYPNIRLISLNSVLFSNKARGEKIDEAAEAELNWLHHELVMAGKNHQRVIIATHIPPAVDVYLLRLKELWKTTYINRFEQDLDLFKSEIAGVLTAHLHMDWSGQLKGVFISGSPSISPNLGNHPGFKLYRFSPDTGELYDDKTYYLNADNVWYGERKATHQDVHWDLNFGG